MENKLTKSQVVAILLATLAFVLALLMLAKSVGKRVLNGRFCKKHRLTRRSRKTKKIKISCYPVPPSFPYGQLTKEYIQPPVFTEQIQVVEEEDLGHKLHHVYAATLYIHVRYDISRSILVLLLSKAIDLPVKETDEANFYIITNLFPQKHKSFQSCVYKTSAPDLNETFEFTLPLEYLLLQRLKFSLWSFDRFSHHEVVADGLLHLNDLEKYGLSISREICVAKTLGLVPKASGICGEIFLSLGYLSLAERLAVVVIKVINLPKINELELPDPYVEVSLLCADRKPKVKKTSTKPNQQNPIYNETLTFNVPAERLHKTSLLFSVLSKKENSSNLEILGNVLLGPEASGENFDHWDYMRTSTKPTGKWHKLRQ